MLMGTKINYYLLNRATASKKSKRLERSLPRFSSRLSSIFGVRLKLVKRFLLFLKERKKSFFLNPV